MSEPKRTIELNIPRTAEERVKASSEWHCAGCGIPVPDLVKRCNCITMVACKDGYKSVWMIDPNDPPHIINLRGYQIQLDADDCNVGVSRQALEKTLADYAHLRAEVARLTEGLDKAREANKEAIAQIARLAREAGEATGKLEASELPGIIDGWRERAQSAEAERDAHIAHRNELREVYDKFIAELGCADLGEVADRLLKAEAALAELREGVSRLPDRINTKLNNYLCEMRPNQDDSIVGFNEAWDIVRDDLRALIEKENSDGV